MSSVELRTLNVDYILSLRSMIHNIYKQYFITEYVDLEAYLIVIYLVMLMGNLQGQFWSHDVLFGIYGTALLTAHSAIKDYDNYALLVNKKYLILQV